MVGEAHNMMSERRILIAFVCALGAVILLAVVAMQRPVDIPEQVATADLPTCTTCVDGFEPEMDACVASGGTIRYTRFTECFNEPDVYDACGFGIPCFTSGDGSYCREAKDPFCHCEADTQCPENYYCQFDERSPDGKTFEPILESGQCWRIIPDSTEPIKELRTYPSLRAEPLL